MFTTTALLTALAAAATVSAHFTLDYPPTRGFDDDKEPEFCGGFTDPSSPRNVVPLTGNVPIHLDSHHASAAVALLISSKEDPQNFDDFSSTLAKSWFQMPQGETCFNVDFSSLGMNFVNGSQVTIQVQYNGGDGNLFQCSDLVLVDGAQVPSNETCTSDDSLASNATVTATPTAATAAVTGTATATEDHDHSDHTHSVAL
ncbi:hypothetical protein HD553DRAFT_126541 [Filobasidium floriforme]|uniref:uncharacterized protein n=1 Tax=Filobasidium floriforme TaxID=5210 RepID=UPI001E8E238F|nr:uncharacterized protein HD553DRAFT_126541 [Filobasidium floriforme]KAH8079961.1 hypothetical protein HD553DRAFT_126541 [Filobasidium floriforme]